MEKSPAQTVIFWLVFTTSVLVLAATLALPTAVPPTTQWAQLVFIYFINTFPFLIFGSLTAGFLVHYLSPPTLKTNTPQNLRHGLLTTGLLGLALPFGPVGIIPVAWVLYQKGFPSHLTITLLLAAPAVNPITFLALVTTFGISWAILVTVLSLIIAIITGIVTHRFPQLITTHHHIENAPPPTAHHPPPTTHHLWTSITTAADTLLTFLPYFIIGCLLAAVWDLIALTTLFLGRLPALIAVLPVALFSAQHPLMSELQAAVSTSTAATITYLTLSTMLGLTTTTTLTAILKPRVLIFLLLSVPLLSLLCGLIITLFT